MLFKIVLLIIKEVWAADSTYAQDTSAFSATDGCARCILKGNAYATTNSAYRVLITQAEEPTSGTCSQTASAGSLSHSFTTPINSVEGLIGACPFQKDICITKDSSGTATNTNIVTFSAVGDSATLELDGSTKTISKATSYCTWVIKSTCGAPGFVMYSQSTSLTDSDFKISVLEYTTEFTSSKSPPTTLEDTVFWPKDKSPNDNSEKLYYDDAVSVAGEFAAFEETLGTTNSYVRKTPGNTVIDWITWTKAVYAQYEIDRDAFNNQVVQYKQDPDTMKRPTFRPMTPSAYAGPTLTSDKIKKGWGASSSGMFLKTHVGKSFGVQSAVPKDTTQKPAEMGVRFRKEQTNSCDDSYLQITVVADSDWAGGPLSKVLLGVENYNWLYDLETPVIPSDALEVPAAVLRASEKGMRIGTSSFALVFLLFAV